MNIDLVYNVDHFVRPGETISSTKFEQFCGGKGHNQSIALAKAGANVYHAGCVGKDGQMLIDMLNKNGVNTKHIKQIDTPSGNASIQIDAKGQNCIVLYGGSNECITSEFVDDVLSDFGKGDFILLQNEINCLNYIIEKAYEKGLSIALNPSPFNEKINKLDLNKITYFLLNEIEGKELTGKDDATDIVTELKQMYPKCIVILTRGKDGVLYYDKDNTFTHGIYDVKVVDTTAAGDTFTGYFLASIVKGEVIPEALRLASIASSIAVSIKGASNSIPALDQVKNSALKLIK